MVAWFEVVPALGAVMLASRRAAVFSLCVEPVKKVMTPKQRATITKNATNRIIGLLPGYISTT
jgi:hypothetical protein